MTTADDERIDRLLGPSLGRSAARSVTIYSLRACFFVGFFAGAPALLIFAGLNSRRLGRLKQDAWFYAAFAVALAALFVWLGQLAATAPLPEWMEMLGEGPRAISNVNRLAAFVVLGALYALHRPYFRASAMSRDPHPSPWVPGIVCSLIGGAITIGIAALAMASA